MKDSLVQQLRRLVRFHGAVFVFNDAAVKRLPGPLSSVARVPGGFDRWLRRPWRGLLIDPEANVTYIIMEDAVKGENRSGRASLGRWHH